MLADMPSTPPTSSVLSDTRDGGSKGHQQSLSTTAVERKLPIAFSKLSYEVGKKDNKKKILDEVDGVFQPGRMCALMGPSGCGKTTLIDVLSGRKNTGKISGTVYFGGVTCVHEQLKTLCGYVEQFDNLVQELTVEEMFMYTAELKLPKLNKVERTARVEECISALGLSTCRKTVIGGALIRGISGGQLKRTNIGLSLITRPPVIFLDEPTSGLDSFMAHEVCLIMAQLAQEGRTIVATIHSPTARSFALFDDLVMLRSGLMTYAGPSNSAAETYFTTTLGVPPLGVGESLPEWLVDLTCAAPSEGAEGGNDGADKAEAGEVPAETKRIADLYKASAAHAALLKLAEENGAKGGGKPLTVSTSLSRANPLSAVLILLKYRAGKDYKSPEFLGPRIGDKIIFGLVVMSMYWGEGSKTDPQSIQSICGVLFMVTALCGYGAAAVVPSLVLDRPLFYREINDGCYGELSYYAFKMLEEGFLCIWTSLLFILIVYWAVGFQGNFGVMVLIYYLTTMISISLAYAIATIAPNLDAASAMLPTYVTTAMFGGGLIMTISTMPPWWSWWHWTSFIRYAWAAQMNNHFDGTATGQMAFLIDKNGQQQNIMQFFSIDGFIGSTWVCIGMLCVPLAFFVTCGGCVIKRVRHVSR